MKQLSWGLERDGLWLQTYEDEGTGFGILSTGLGRSLSLQFRGKGILVGWMYRQKVAIQVYEIED